MSEILFEQIGLSPELKRAVHDMNYTAATGIQAGAIPLLLKGLDVIGRSSTGTGKTAAFGIPAVERTIGTDKHTQVLILSPTRELAMQITQEIRKYAKYKPGISVAAVYGGAPMDPQIRALRTANIVIGTPGRVMDHMRRRTLRLDSVRTVVLDEADEMLNMGFLDDIREILSQTPEERQTVLFSATMPPAILKITEDFLRHPHTVHIRTGQKTIASTEQYFYQVPQARKMDAVNLLLQYHDPKRSVIFCNTKSMVDELTAYLSEHGFRAMGLHGDMKQGARSQVMQSFRDGRTQILVATDVAARGIDVENVQAVYNYDIPQEFEYYIHRIGRTGRAGKTGSSHTLVCNRRQLLTIRDLKRYINAQITELPLPSYDQLTVKKQDKLSAKVAGVLQEGVCTEQFGAQIAAMCQTHGSSAHEIACALAAIISKKDRRTIPAFKAAAERTLHQRGGKRVALSVNIGRAQQITPNYIVGAIVDGAGLASRAVGRIDIHTDYTLIEMLEDDALTVLSAMQNARIKGTDVSFSLSDEKVRDYHQKERTHRHVSSRIHRIGRSERRRSHEN